MAYTGGKLTIEEALAAVHCYALMYGTGTEIPKEEFAQWTWDTNIYYEGEKHTTFYPENKEKEFTLASNYFVEYLPMDNYNGDGYADRTGTAIQEVFKFNSAAEEHDPNKILENIIAAMDDPGKYKKQIQSIRDDLVSFEEFQKRTELFKERQDILKASVMLDQLELYMLTIGGEKDTRDIRIRHEDNNPSQKAFDPKDQHRVDILRQQLFDEVITITNFDGGNRGRKDLPISGEELSKEEKERQSEIRHYRLTLPRLKPWDS